MRYYALEPLDEYEWIAAVDPKDDDLLDFDGTPRENRWRPVNVEIVKYSDDGEPLLEADFPSPPIATLVM